MSKRAKSISSAHPCHNLSNPDAQIFMCRHCMAKFYDPIQRWRHSKMCKKGSNNKDAQDQVRNTVKRPIYSNCTAQEFEKPKEPIPVKRKKVNNAANLNCFICKKVFASMDEMREHVKKACNKPETPSSHSAIASGDIIMNQMYLSPQRKQFENQLKKFNDTSSHGEEVVTNQIESLLKAAQALHQQQQKQQHKLEQLLQGVASDGSVQEQLTHQGGLDSSLTDDGYLRYAVLDVNSENQPSYSDVGQSEQNGIATLKEVSNLSTSQLITEGNLTSSLPVHFQEGSLYPNSIIEIQVPTQGQGSGVLTETIDNSCPQQIYEVHISRNDLLTQEQQRQLPVTIATICKESMSNSDLITESQSSGGKVNSLDEPDVFELISQVIGEDLDRLRPADQTTVLQNAELIVEQNNLQNQLMSTTNKISVSDSGSVTLKDSSPVITTTNSNNDNTSSSNSVITCNDSQSNQHLNSPQIHWREQVPCCTQKDEGRVNCVQQSEENMGDNSVSKKRTELSNQVESSQGSPSYQSSTVKEIDKTLGMTNKDMGVNKCLTHNDHAVVEKSQKDLNPSLENYLSKDNATCEKKSVNLCNEREVAHESSTANQNSVDEIDGEQTHDHNIKLSKSPQKLKKPKVAKIPKCRICDKEFRTVELLRKHNKVPCKIRLTRNLTQKVLRPKRIKEQPIQSKQKKKKQTKPLPERPKLLSFSDRRFSDLSLDPNKNKKGKCKTRRKAMLEYNFCITGNQEYHNPKLDVHIEYDTLPEKEQHFFHLGLVSTSQLPHNYKIRKTKMNASSNCTKDVINVEKSVIVDEAEPLPPVLEKESEVVGQLRSDIYILSDDGYENSEPPILMAVLDGNAVESFTVGDESGKSVSDLKNSVSTCSTTEAENSHDSLQEQACINKNYTENADMQENGEISQQLSRNSDKESSQWPSSPGNLLESPTQDKSPIKVLTERHFTDAIDICQETFCGDGQLQHVNSSNAEICDTALAPSTSCNDSSRQLCGVTVGLQTDIPAETDKIMYPRAPYHRRFLKKLEKYNRENAENKSKSPTKEKDDRKNLFESLAAGKNDASSCEISKEMSTVTVANSSTKLTEPTDMTENLFDRFNHSLECRNPSKDGKSLNDRIHSVTKKKSIEEIVVYPKTPLLQDKKDEENNTPKLYDYPVSDPVYESLHNEEVEPCITRKPCEDVEAVSYQNGKNLLDLIAKTLGIFPPSSSLDGPKDTSDDMKSENQSSVNTSPVDQTMEKNRDNLLNQVSSNNNGDVQIIIMNNNSDSDAYTMGIDVINLPKNLTNKHTNNCPNSDKFRTLGDDSSGKHGTQTQGDDDDDDDKFLLDGFSERLSKFVPITTADSELPVSELGQSVLDSSAKVSGELQSRSSNYIFEDRYDFTFSEMGKKTSVSEERGCEERDFLLAQGLSSSAFDINSNSSSTNNNSADNYSSGTPCLEVSGTLIDNISCQTCEVPKNGGLNNTIPQTNLGYVAPEFVIDVDLVRNNSTLVHGQSEGMELFRKDPVDKVSIPSDFTIKVTSESNKNIESETRSCEIGEAGDSILPSITENIASDTAMSYPSNEQQINGNLNEIVSDLLMEPEKVNGTGPISLAPQSDDNVPDKDLLSLQKPETSTIGSDQDTKVMVQYVEQVESDTNVSYVVIDNGIEICRTETGMEDTMYEDSDDEPYLGNDPYLSDDEQIVYSETVST